MWVNHQMRVGSGRLDFCFLKRQPVNRINHVQVLGMPLEEVSDERTEGDNREFLLLRETKNALDQFGADAFSAKGVGNFGMDQLERTSLPAIQEKCCGTVLS